VAAKYIPLRRYLATQSAQQVVLTLPEIEAILGSTLPPTACKAGFWDNNAWTNGPARSWRAAGWRVARRTYRPPTWAITFERDGHG
jgi:hypothetical protein